MPTRSAASPRAVPAGEPGTASVRGPPSRWLVRGGRPLCRRPGVDLARRTLGGVRASSTRWRHDDDTAVYVGQGRQRGATASLWHAGPDAARTRILALTRTHGVGPPSADDKTRVAALLGREPAGNFTVAVRGPDGEPTVIENDPLLRDGTPMPTRFWLVDFELRALVGRLEAAGGVREAETAVDPEVLAECHQRYAQERDARIAPGWTGPRPGGGVGGRVRESSVCTPTWPGGWPAETIRSAPGPPVGSESPDRGMPEGLC